MSPSRSSSAQPGWRWSYLPVAFLILPLFLVLNGCYLLGQGGHYLGHQIRAESLERAEAERPDRVAFFDEVRRIRRFGSEGIGLSRDENYTTFVELERDYLVAVVSAARPTSFERKTWWYPVVGEAPYRGYYNIEGARRLSRKLKRRGWETVVRRVDAFSSLGFFRDPLYSFMTGYHPERLANLLIHEMTHATLWIPNDAPLNEAAATFVGDVGSLLYLEERYGRESELYAEALSRRADRERFLAFMRDLAERLEEHYLEDLSEESWLSGKERIIAAAKAELKSDLAAWSDPEAYSFLLEMEINNAYVDLFRTYNSDVGLIEDLYAAVGEDLSFLVNRLQSVAEAKEPRRRLEELTASERG